TFGNREHLAESEIEIVKPWAAERVAADVALATDSRGRVGVRIKPKVRVWVSNIGVADLIRPELTQIRPCVLVEEVERRVRQTGFKGGNAAEVPATKKCIDGLATARPVTSLAKWELPHVANSERVRAIEIGRSMILPPIQTVALGTIPSGGVTHG